MKYACETCGRCFNSEENCIMHETVCNEKGAIKIYKSDIDGKRAFVKEVLSPLLVQSGTGWYGAEYEHDEPRRCETVYLLNEAGDRCNAIDVSADSNEAIIRDVFKRL